MTLKLISHSTNFRLILFTLIQVKWLTENEFIKNKLKANIGNWNVPKRVWLIFLSLFENLQIIKNTLHCYEYVAYCIALLVYTYFFRLVFFWWCYLVHFLNLILYKIFLYDSNAPLRFRSIFVLQNLYYLCFPYIYIYIDAPKL